MTGNSPWDCMLCEAWRCEGHLARSPRQTAIMHKRNSREDIPNECGDFQGSACARLQVGAGGNGTDANIQKPASILQRAYRVMNDGKENRSSSTFGPVRFDKR